MPRRVYPEGTIKTSRQGAQFIKVNGKWEYMKKPREEWKTPLPKPKERVEYNYPPIKIPENMRETSYPGYYITEDGDAYREPGKYDRTGTYGEINEWGLIYLKPALRGNPNTSKDKMYHCVNISIRDDNGKYVRQIKRSNHQLVAEAYVPNPHGYTEILHIDDNNRNNHYSNLKWGTHEENMKNVRSPCTETKTYKITDLTTGQVWEGNNLAEWCRNHMDLIVPRIKSGNSTARSVSRNLSNIRRTGGSLWNFKVEY